MKFWSLFFTTLTWTDFSFTYFACEIQRCTLNT